MDGTEIIHKPKLISSRIGLGLPTNSIQRRQVTDEKMISMELWNAMIKPWAEGSTTIALPGYRWLSEWVVGREFLVTRFTDANGKTIAHYFDLCTPIQKHETEFTFLDLYLDVWHPTGETPRLLDENELDEAIKVGHISEKQAERARRTAEYIIGNISELESFVETNKIDW